MDNKFKYQHSKLLQLIYEAHKDNIISNEEKTKIKGKDF